MGIAELGYLSESMSREVEERYRRGKERSDRNTARLIKKRPALCRGVLMEKLEYMERSVEFFPLRKLPALFFKNYHYIRQIIEVLQSMQFAPRKKSGRK